MKFSKMTLMGLSILLTLIGIGIGGWQAYAQNNTTLEPDTLINGQLGANDQARWNFEANREAVIEIVINGLNGFQPTLALYNNDNELLFQIPSSDGNTYIYRVPQFGTYAIEIGSEDRSGEYELSFSFLEAGLSSFEQGTLFFGDIIQQRITDQTPYNVWTFDGRAGQVIDIRMRTQTGDLLPTFSLISPGGDVVATSRNEDDNAYLSSFRLEGDGVYIISARRQGEDLGFGGDTTGEYSLGIIQRNGIDANAEAIPIETQIQGRLTTEAPLARYRVGESGIYALELHMSNPLCIAAIAVVNEGNSLLSNASLVPPIMYTVEIPELQTPTIEISSPNCNTMVNFNFTMRRINHDTVNIRHLATDVDYPSVLPSGSDRWYFAGDAGDLIRLSGQKDSNSEPSRIQVFDASNREIYEKVFFNSFDEIISLQNKEIYTVAVSSQVDINYTIRREFIGSNNIPLSLTEPDWEQAIDIDSIGLWSVKMDVPENALLVIEEPNGEIIKTSKASPLIGISIDNIHFNKIGRYSLKLYGVETPRSLSLNPIQGGVLHPNTSEKGYIISPQTQNTWIIENENTQLFNILLETINANETLPEAYLIQSNGIIVEPTTIEQTEAFRYLLGFNINPSEQYRLQIQPSISTNASRLDYRISYQQNSINEVDLDDGVTTTENDNPSFVRPIVDNPNFVIPPLDVSLLNPAENPRLRVPSSQRSEIQNGTIREIWYAPIVRGQFIYLTATNLSHDVAPHILVTDANGNTLVEQRDNRSNRTELYYRTPIASDYYVVITMPVGRYLLTSQTLPNLDETIPVIQDIVPLDIGTPYTDNFRRSREEHVYAFWGIAGMELSISAPLTFGNLTPTLQVFDEFGSLLTETSEESTDLRVEISTNGLYTIRAIASDERDELFTRYNILVSTLISQNVDDSKIEIGETVEGNIPASQDRDTWLLYANAGERINLSVSPLSTQALAPISISLQDTDGNAFITKATQITSNEVKIDNFIIPITGLYRIFITGGQDQYGSYALSVMSSGNSEIDVNTISYGAVTNGIFTPDKTIETWWFAAQADDVISVASRSIWGDPATLNIQILDSDHNVIGATANSELQQGARLDDIVIPTNGFYQINVGQTEMISRGSSYALSLELQNSSSIYSYGRIARPNQTYQGTIYANDTTDYWILDATNNLNVAISIEGVGDTLNPRFDLIDISNNNTVILSRSAIETSIAQVSNFTLDPNKVYGIAISNTNGTIGNYALSVASNQLIDLPTRTADFGIEYETQFIYQKGHVWEFSVNEGDEISAQITTPRRSSFLPQVTIVDTAGNILIFANEFDGEAINIPTYKFAQDGTYHLIIEPSNDDVRSNRGDYTLLINRVVDISPAETAQTIQDQQTLTGIVNREEPNSLWQFEGLTDEFVGISLDSSIDLQFAIRAPNGDEIAYVDDSNGSLNPEIILQLPQNGTYQIYVTPFGGYQGQDEINYRINLQKIYRLPANIQNEQFIIYGESVANILETNEQNHIWYFSGQMGDEISIILQYLELSQPLLLTLVDGDGNIRYVQGIRNSDRTTIDNFTLPIDGIYQIIISQTPTAAIEQYSPYVLHLNLIQGNQSSSNNFMLTAYKSYGDTLEPDSGNDKWIYSAQAGELVSVSLVTIDSTVPIIVNIFAPDERLIHRADQYQFSAQLPVAGTYQIEVLSLHELTESIPYRIFMSNTTDTTDIAGTLTLGQSTQGTFDSIKQENHWTITTLEDNALDVRVNKNVDLYLRNENNRIIYSGSYKKDIQQTTLQIPQIPAGTYNILVIAKSMETGNYTIQVMDQYVSSETLMSTLLSNGESVIQSINGGESHFYSFYALTQIPLSLEAITTSENIASPMAEVYTSLGEFLFSFTQNNLDFIPPYDGYYLLKVTSSEPVTYQVTKYQRTVTDTLEQRSIVFNVNMPGNISLDAPVELWSFSANSGQTFNIELEDFNNDVLHDIVVYAPDGRPMEAITEINDENQINLNIITLQNGRYTIRVGAVLGKVSNRPFGTQYAISVTPVDSYDNLNLNKKLSVPQVRFSALTSEVPINQWDVLTQIDSNYEVAIRSYIGSVQLIVKNAEGEIITTPYILQEGEQHVTFIENTLGEMYVVEVSSQSNEVSTYSISLNPLDLPEDNRETGVYTNFTTSDVIGVNQTRSSSMSAGVPVQSWALDGHLTGTHTITIQTEYPSWGGYVSIYEDDILLQQNPLDGNSEIQLDQYLNVDRNYVVEVQSFSINVQYDISFYVTTLPDEPRYLVVEQPEVSILSNNNEFDEWIYESSASSGEVITIQVSSLDDTINTLNVSIFAPNGLMLQERQYQGGQQITIENLIVPVAGNYVIEVLQENIYDEELTTYEISVQQIENP